jgi:excisionase family DNA binding protein
MAKTALSILDRAVGVTEAARLLGVGDRAITSAIQRGHLPATKVPSHLGGRDGKRYLIQPDDLRAYDRRRRTPANEKRNQG